MLGVHLFWLPAFEVIVKCLVEALSHFEIQHSISCFITARYSKAISSTKAFHFTLRFSYCLMNHQPTCHHTFFNWQSDGELFHTCLVHSGCLPSASKNQLDSFHYYHYSFCLFSTLKSFLANLILLIACLVVIFNETLWFELFLD